MMFLGWAGGAFMLAGGLVGVCLGWGLDGLLLGGLAAFLKGPLPGYGWFLWWPGLVGLLSWGAITDEPKTRLGLIVALSALSGIAAARPLGFEIG